jgi:branched-chain amino acid transport system ATP-binding protein
MLLEVHDLSVYYDDIRALWGISFDVEAGEIVAILGSNGAGKTTTLKAISGVMRPREGTITFDGKRLDQMPSHKVVEAGIAHVPEGRRLFPMMTVYENLEMGSLVPHARTQRQQTIKRVFELFPRLEERREQLAGTLSGGEQQMLAIGRGLMSLPKLLILDEPSLGLAPLIVQNVFQVVEEVNNNGVTVLIVEQNVQQALRVAHRAYVIETGRLVLSGTGAELLHDPQVREAYLGGHDVSI